MFKQQYNTNQNHEKHCLSLFCCLVSAILLFTASLHTAWLLNLAHASNWHKTEDKILLIIPFLSPTLVDFHIPNKEIKMMAEII